jgi:phosphatidylglycerophosphate synthase
MGDRRPIPARSNRLSVRAARWLADAGVQPNHISIASIVIAAAGAACLILSRQQTDAVRYPLLLIAAAAIPLRLLCNMLDGMVAVEFGKASPTGNVYNELPDRIADAVLLVGAGYAVREHDWVAALGWSAALLAVVTAYVRTLGAALGVPQDYSGPMAKQQRMALLAVACVGAAIEVAVGGDGYALTTALTIITAGAGLTAALRTRRLLRALEQSR